MGQSVKKEKIGEHFFSHVLKLIVCGVVALFLFAPPANAATTTFNVNWATGFESFAWTQTSCTLLATCTQGRVNDTGVGQQVLFTRAAGVLNAAHGGYWSRSLTWQTMGVPVGATVTQVNGSIQAKSHDESAGNPAHDINIFLFDSANTTNIVSGGSAVEPNFDPTPLGSWVTANASGNVSISAAYQDYNTNVTIRLGHTSRSGIGLIPVGESRIHNFSLIITYELPQYGQNNWRLFSNTNSTDVGAPLASQNTSYQMVNNGEQFRLRQFVGVSTAKSFANIDNFKLQFVDKGSGSCASPSGGTPASYTDVTAGTAIAFYNNSTPADGAALTPNANDPTFTGFGTTKFTYEEANNFTNSSDINIGNGGMWDFSLYDNTAPSGKTYCFRIVKSDGTALTSYSQYAEISTRPAQLTVDIVDAGGTPVADPTVVFPPFVQRAVCKTNAATLGVSSQRIRVFNSTANPEWTVSIAATDGVNSFWENGSNFFDFNDPGPDNSGCIDHIDADSYPGQLTIDASGSTISPESGCTAAGITKGSLSKFNQGITDSITLLSSSVSTSTECYWDITGIDLLTTLPGGLVVGTYSLDFTITIIAN